MLSTQWCRQTCVEAGTCMLGTHVCRQTCVDAGTCMLSTQWCRQTCIDAGTCMLSTHACRQTCVDAGTRMLSTHACRQTCVDAGTCMLSTHACRQTCVDAGTCMLGTHGCRQTCAGCRCWHVYVLEHTSGGWTCRWVLMASPLTWKQQMSANTYWLKSNQTIDIKLMDWFMDSTNTSSLSQTAISSLCANFLPAVLTTIIMR